MMYFILSVSILILLYELLMLIKIDNAYKNQEKILYAIDRYIYETNNYIKGFYLLESMEDFDATIFRLTDWGYKNILPKEDFELIESYIQ